MSVLEIQVLGSPILREPTTPVAQVTDDVRRVTGRRAMRLEESLGAVE